MHSASNIVISFFIHVLLFLSVLFPRFGTGQSIPAQPAAWKRCVCSLRKTARLAKHVQKFIHILRRLCLAHLVFRGQRAH